MTPVFVDTMGWFSLFHRRDQWHGLAADTLHRLRDANTPLVTTDYVIDETATLLKIRGAYPAIRAFFEMLDTTRALTCTPVAPDRFRTARAFFLKHLDHGYSFTDVTRFVVMHELRLRAALTHDAHFEEAGFERLLR